MQHGLYPLTAQWKTPAGLRPDLCPDKKSTMPELRVDSREAFHNLPAACFGEKAFRSIIHTNKLSEMKKMLEFLRRTTLGLAFALVLLSSTSADATTWYVKPAGNDANVGNSWAAAFKTVQKALASAASDDQIWVAAGTYFPDEGPGITNDDRSVAFVMKNGVEILGGFPATGNPNFPSRNWTANPTILSGNIGTVGNDLDNSFHVILNFENNLNATAILDGFTITGGRADWISSHNWKGGGMHNDASSPSIRNCIFSENFAQVGGGMYNHDASVTVNNCSFLDNTSEYSGGGIVFVLGASSLNNCVFSGNTSTSTGGGMFISQTSTTVNNCVFSGNFAVLGGGIHNNAATPTIANCSFAGNTASDAGGGMNNYRSSPTLHNCIFWGNNTGVVDISSTTVITYSIVQGGYPGTGNLDTDPLFVDQPDHAQVPTTAGNLRLQACSPAIDAGLDANNTTTTDLAGNNRKIEAIPGGQKIDMGAYEYQQLAPVLTAICKTFTAYLGSNGTVSVSGSDIDNGSAALCAATLSINGQPSITYSCSDIGSHTATLLVHSPQNNRSASCQTTVTVADNTRPQVSCKRIDITLGSNNTASIVPADVLQSSSDNCGTVNLISVSPNSFDCSDLGPNTIFLQASDGNGNFSNCSSTVVVYDETSPTVNCKNHTVTLSAAGSASIEPTDVFLSGSDNCGTVNPAFVNPSTFTCADIGQSTVSLLVFDNNGNSANCTATVTVLKTTPPKVTCKNAAIALSSTGTAVVAPIDVFQGGTDDCSTVNLASVAPNSFTCANIGPNTVALTVNDGNGNTASCTATVTISDNTPPQVVCKNHAVALNPSGSASIAPAHVFQSGSDNCGTVNLASVAPNSFTCANIGPNTVALTVNDGNGNTASCTATVTISDNTPPQAVCKNHAVALNQNGSASIAPADVFQSGSDNCGTVNPASVAPNSFTCANIGPNTVALTVNDGHGNTASCNATVTVQDNTPPQVECKNHVVALNQNGSASIAPADLFQSGSDNCGTVNPASLSLNSFACTQVGPITVTLTVNDGHGNTATCTATVTVQDNILPSIVCPQNLVRNTDPNQCTAIATYTTPTVTDNCSNWTLMRTGGLASGSAFPQGANMVQWKVTDPGGNTALCQFTVTVSDAQAPAITCPANIVKNTDAGLCTAVVTYTNPIYSDNCTGGGVAIAPPSLTSGSQFPIGITNVVWQATDGAALTKRCTFTVTVNDNQLPIIACPANQTKAADAGICTAVVNYTTPTFTDNCAGAGLAIQSGMVSGSAFPKGQTTVVWRATDAVGLTKTCTFRVTVNDTQAPTFTLCPSTQSVNTDAGSCTAAVTYAIPTASDNCTPPPTVVKQSGLASGSNFPKGSSTVVWRATDGAGLTKTCSFTVTVTDAQLPTITCPGNIAVTGSSPSCNATVAYPNPTATDNCAVQSLSLLSGPASGSGFPVGMTSVVWKAVDNSGQSATCFFTVTVNCGTSSQEFESRSSKFEVPDATHGLETGQTSNFKLSNFKLSPNPASDRAVIEIIELSHAASIELTVYDLQGRLMWQQRSVGEQTVLELDDHWQSGVYFVTLRSEGQSVTKRLVVSRL